MADKKTDLNDFTVGSIPLKLVRFMLPILAALVLQAMYGAVDILVVGQFGESTAISGVSTGGSIIHMFTFLCVAFSTGVTILISRLIGEKKQEEVPYVIGSAIFMFAIIAIVMGAFCIAFASQLATWMKAPAEAVNDTVTYIRICGGGLIFIVFYNLISAIFRGFGDSKWPLVFVGIAAGINVVGDMLLVAGLKMNVAGAAIATVAAQAVSVVLSLIVLVRRQKSIGFKLSHIRPNAYIAQFTKTGAPLALQEVLIQFSFLALAAFINDMGLLPSSGYGIANKLISFVMLVPSAIMQGLAVLVSQNVGAKKEKRAEKVLWTGMGLGVAVGVLVSITVFFFGTEISSIFTNNAEYAAQSGDYLRGFCSEAVLTCVVFSFIGYFNGHNKTLITFIQAVSSTLLVRLPMAYFMSRRPDANLYLIGYSAPAASVFGIIVCLVFFLIMHHNIYSKGSGLINDET